MSEYEDFINRLEKEDQQACADQIREMIKYADKGNACLRESLKALYKSGQA